KSESQTRYSTLSQYVEVCVDKDLVIEGYREAKSDEVFDELAALLKWKHDRQPLQEMIDEHAKLRPKSTSVAYWTAWLAMQREEYATVQTILEPVANEIELGRYSYLLKDLYRRAMVSQGKAVFALENAREKDLAFRNLCQLLLAKEQSAELNKLIVAYETSDHDEHELAFFRSHWSTLIQDHNGAMSWAEKSINDTQPDYFNDQRRYRYWDAAYDAHRVIEAYNNAGKEKESCLRHLVPRAYRDGRIEDFKNLLKLHESTPGSKIRFEYAFLLAAIEEKWDRAEVLVKQLPNTSKYSWFVGEFLVAAIRAGAGQDVVSVVDPDGEKISSVEEKAFENRDPEFVEKCIAAYADRFPDEKLQLLHARLAELNGEYQKAIDHYAGVKQGRTYSMAHMLAQEGKFNCYLHLGRLDDARKLAESDLNDNGEPWFLLKVLAVERNQLEFRQLIPECEDFGYGIEEMYADPIIREALESDEFATLRKDYPPPKKLKK
ncbi:MAG: hypothetical protein ACI9G1_005878, partial [Pirellulaceae bacterium]